VRTGGQFILTGPADTFIEGNTNLGMALNMILPLVLFLRREETRPWVRHLLLTMFVLIIISIIMTYSRGALLGLFAVIFFLLLKSKAKLLLVPLVAFSIIFALNVLPGQWIEKMHTIETYEEDPSAISRIIAWEVGYRMALDRPFFGSGFASFTDEMYHKHLPGEKLEKAILGTGGHSIIFQTLAEHGFTGLIIYILLIFTTMLSLRNIIRRSKEDQKMRWIYNYAQMLEVSFIGFLVSGLFLSMQNFDLFYGLIAITIILKKLFLVQKVE
jgi:probable O-glycosylation ligase (exosortase A-associated)